jgi:uncharacterized BrkB/YihY/UPF0761 family membrane protein
MGLYGLLQLPQQIWVYLVGQLFLFGAVFYFFVFEQTFGVSALMDEFTGSQEGVRK